jgi:site-specific DNA recombinase
VRASTAGTGGNQTVGRRHKPAYRCRQAKCVVRDCVALDHFVGRLVVARLERPDATELFAPRPVDGSQDLRLEAAALRRRLDSLAEAHADGLIDVRQLSVGSERIRGRLSDVENQLAAVSSQPVLVDLAARRDVAKVWAGMDLSRRRLVVDTLMAVTILPAKRGRPAGWVKGDGYFDPEAVRIDWKVHQQ